MFGFGKKDGVPITHRVRLLSSTGERLGEWVVQDDYEWDETSFNGTTLDGKYVVLNGLGGGCVVVVEER